MDKKLNDQLLDDILSLYDKGMSIKQICSKLNKNDCQIRYALKKNKLNWKDLKFNRIKHDIVKLYKEGNDVVAIGRKLHCSPVIVTRTLKNNNIKIRGGSLLDRLDINFDLIIKKYQDGIQSGEIGKIFNITRHQVVAVLKYFHIPRRNGKWISRTKTIINMYENKVDMIEIGRRIGCSDVTVARILKNNGVDIRPYIGKNVYSWVDDRTIDKAVLSDYYKYKRWVSDCYKKHNNVSSISNAADNLQCHHIYGLRYILPSLLIKNKCLFGINKRLAVEEDNRLYDIDNSLILTKKEHNNIEYVGRKAHYYWRIWKHYPEFALSYFPFTKEQYELFDDNGMMDSSKSNILSVNTKYCELKKILRYEHYLGTIPPHRIILVNQQNDIITGIAVFGQGSNKNRSKDCWELSRLCVPYYVIKPSTIDFLNKCIKYIKINYKNVKNLIAYSDPNVGHDGAVYRMGGWIKAGKSQPSYCYFDPNINQLKHKSYCRRIKNINKTEQQLAQERGLLKIKLSPLKRYTYSLGV